MEKVKRKDEEGEGEKKIAPSLFSSFLFFSSSRCSNARSSYSSIRRAPLCCAGAAFCQPGEERNTLSLVKRNTMGLADRTVSSKSEQGDSDSRCAVGRLIGSFFGGVEEGSLHRTNFILSCRLILTNNCSTARQVSRRFPLLRLRIERSRKK